MASNGITGINTHAITSRKSSVTEGVPPGDWSRSREYPAGYRVLPLCIWPPAFLYPRVSVSLCVCQIQSSLRLNPSLAIARCIAIKSVRPFQKSATKWIQKFLLAGARPYISHHCCRASTTSLWLNSPADIPMRPSCHSLAMRRWKYIKNKNTFSLRLFVLVLAINIPYLYISNNQQ